MLDAELCPDVYKFLRSVCMGDVFDEDNMTFCSGEERKG